MFEGAPCARGLTQPGGPPISEAATWQKSQSMGQASARRRAGTSRSREAGDGWAGPPSQGRGRGARGAPSLRWPDVSVGNEGTKPRPSAEMGGQVSVRTGEFPESPHLGLGRAIPR